MSPGHLARLRGRIFGPRRRSILHYELLELLGKGGFGRVHRAHDPKLKRDVALKELTFRSPGELLRIEREAQALARLSHPNVVQVYDCGIADETTYFIAMELVEGPTLASWQAESGRTRSEILEQYLHVARGLHAAHRAGLVHRDFKPTNAAVASDGRARVLDFGLVKVVHEPPSIDSLGVTADELRPADRSSSSSEGVAIGCAAAPATEATAENTEGCADRSPFADPSAPRDAFECGTGEPLTVETTQVGFRGTVRYAAPEQFLQRAVDPRADQYSFCVALFEAVFHRHPFLGRSSAGVRASAERRELAWPDDRRTPAWLDRLLARGLAEHPEDRFESMEAVVAELERRLQPPRRWPWALAVASLLVGIFVPALLSSAPVECGDFEEELAGVWDEEIKGEVTQRLAAGGHADYGTVVVDGFDGYARRWREERGEACRRQALAGDEGSVAHVDATEQIECLGLQGQELRGTVEELLSTSPEEDGVVTEELSLWQVLPLDPRVCREPVARRAIASPYRDGGERARNLLALARAGTLRGLDASAIPAIEEAVALALEQDDPALLSLSRYRLGVAQSLAGRWAEASDNLLEAAVLAEAQGNRLLPIEALAQLAQNEATARRRVGAPPRLGTEGRGDLAVALASAKVEHAGLRGTELEAWVLASAGHLHFARDELQEAELRYRAAADLLADTRGPEDFATQALRMHEAAVMAPQGQVEQARALAEHALHSHAERVGEDSTEIARDYLLMGQLDHIARDLDAALGNYQRAVRLLRIRDGEGGFEEAEARAEIADVLRRQGKLSEAAHEIERAEQVFARNPGQWLVKHERSSRVAMSIYNEQHDWPKLEHAAGVVIDLLERMHSDDRRALAVAARARWVAQLNLDRPCDALALLDRYGVVMREHFDAYMASNIALYEEPFAQCRTTPANEQRR